MTPRYLRNSIPVFESFCYVKENVMLNDVEKLPRLCFPLLLISVIQDSRELMTEKFVMKMNQHSLYTTSPSRDILSLKPKRNCRVLNTTLSVVKLKPQLICCVSSSVFWHTMAVPANFSSYSQTQLLGCSRSQASSPVSCYMVHKKHQWCDIGAVPWP